MDLRNHGTPKFDEKPVIEEPANPQEIDVILEEKDSRIIENKDKKNAVIESCDTNIELLIEFEESVDLGIMKNQNLMKNLCLKNLLTHKMLLLKK